MKIELKGRITKFYPYESVFIQSVIASFRDREVYDGFVKEIESELGFNLSKGKYQEVGFKDYCRLSWDNKVTFEITNSEASVYYIQFYDGSVHLGMSLAKRNYDPITHHLKISY